MNMTLKHLKMPISADRLLVICLSISPLFLLTIANWINGILFLSSALSLYIIVKAKISKKDLIPETISRRWLCLLMAVLASPILAVFLGQCFRQQFSWRYYDSPSRFLICIPILIAVVYCQIRIERLWGYSIAAAAFTTLAYVTFNPNLMWGPDRLTTRFVDPLTFGSLGLTLGLLSLLLINSADNESITIKIYKFCGFGAGLYLSMLSGSRTGWLALPIVIFIWLLFKNPDRRLTSLPLAIGIPFVLSIVFFYKFPIVQQRIALAANELLAYQWNELNPDNSISMRISFYRMGLSLFAQQPLGGWGDTGFSHFLNTPEIARFASRSTRDFVLQNGFHNEIMTNMVRSGIWGMVSTVSLFLIPAMLFIGGLRSKVVPVSILAILGCSYLVCTFISGMSTEVFNLKFTASFHALMITCLTGSFLTSIRSSSPESPTATRAIDSGPEQLPERPGN